MTVKKLLFLFLGIILSAQENIGEITVGELPDSTFLQTMTEREQRIDSAQDVLYPQKLKAIEKYLRASGDSMDERTKSYVLMERARTTLHYRENRARYLFKNYKNGETEGFFPKKDEYKLTSTCECLLENDTIKVNMGFWIFGGFSIELELNQGKFKGVYHEDLHEQFIYKTHLNEDTLSDNYYAGFAKQDLILEAKPHYKIGEHISGYLHFYSEDAYRTADYEEGMACDGCTDSKMDTINTEGVAYFKCKVIGLKPD